MSMGAGKGMTLKQFDELALRYVSVFHFSFSRLGFRQPAMRIALYLFAGMLLSVIPYIMATGSGLLVQGLYLLVMVAFELAGILVWRFVYEPWAREKQVRQAGLLGYGRRYDHKQLEHYKDLWLERELEIRPDQYLVLVKALTEVRELGGKSKQAAKFMGDRLFTGFFSLKPLTRISLIPLFVSLLIGAARLPSVDLAALIADFAAEPNGYLGFIAQLLVLGVGLIICMGFLFLVVGAIRSVILDLWLRRCSVQSRERLVRELLARAELCSRISAEG